MTVQDKLQPQPTRKLLALDGGGIRGLITVEVLAAIEDQLRRERGPDVRLADEFDYVAGTSTGAIIATCVSLGMSVDEIRDFYLVSGREMFDRASLLRRWRSRFDDENLASKLKDVIGPQTTLGSDALRTLLLIVMRNATTTRRGRCRTTRTPSTTRARPATSTSRCGSWSARARRLRRTSRRRSSTWPVRGPSSWSTAG